MATKITKTIHKPAAPKKPAVSYEAYAPVQPINGAKILKEIQRNARNTK